MVGVWLVVGVWVGVTLACPTNFVLWGENFRGKKIDCRVSSPLLGPPPLRGSFFCRTGHAAIARKKIFPIDQISCSELFRQVPFSFFFCFINIVPRVLPMFASS